MANPLSAARSRILQCRGASYEGDICSIMRHSLSLVQSFEFGLGDAALDCTYSYEIEDTFAEQFWNIHEQRFLANEASKFILFDIKSTVGEKAGEQAAADPTFVDVIPNYSQHAAALAEESN
ncbi:hypothetical protein LTR02_007795 [Friedmanniomyces endolithicus]|nr:hypothetical protein LTR75_016546 [Friedmanniomyces endolithicus]KAK0903100.1 hypothetical protein LTR02_007795 [Friedmanniomyces endolithicus]